jgi:hypothetical protein
MTKRRISISQYRQRLGPELGLIFFSFAILVNGRHIGRDTMYSPMVWHFDTEGNCVGGRDVIVGEKTKD